MPQPITAQNVSAARVFPCSSSHLQADTGPTAAVFCNPTTRYIPSAYPGRHSRVREAHALKSRSAGLRTPAGPRLNTCV